MKLSMYLSIYLSALACAPDNPLPFVMYRHICERSTYSSQIGGDATADAQ